MRVIGIDQSYTGFGYCVDGESKKKTFPASKYVNGTDRLLAVEVWLADRLHSIHDGVDLVVMEGYSNASKFGREAAGELGWAVKRTIRDVLDHDPLVVPPTSLKKFVAGKGNAKKNEMLLHVYRKWGVQFADDNQADAFALEKFGLTYLDLLRDKQFAVGKYPKYEIEAIEAVQKVN